MGAQANGAPVIIKRKKVVGGGGHHGGAWKVAYADFVTAMMAFFMLMWLLNATTEQQRKGIADYFSPTIPINRVSGGGNGAFGGDSIFTENTLSQNGTGASGIAQRADAEQAKLEEIADILTGGGGESAVMENALRHIVTRITDEGLVIEIYDLDNIPLFAGDTAQPRQLLRDIATVVAQATRSVRNDIAIGGHVRANPVVLAESPVWTLSTDRATAMRELLEAAGIAETRIQRVTGHADRTPVVRNLMSARNNRLEVILLRDIPRN